MRIGFFGGSFDPPHRGHLAVALAAAEAFALERVLLVPTGVQPLKPAGAVAAYPDRLAMVELLCEAGEGLEASRLEAPSAGTAAGEPNYTIDTLWRLKELLSAGDALFVIVGADAFLGLREWHASESLLTMADWVVVSRPGFSLDALGPVGLSAEQVARVHLLPGVVEPAAASLIRERLGQGGDCAELLTAAVLGYIDAHHLYGR